MKTQDVLISDNNLQTLRDLTQIQCSDGNWNYDPYMHGMANGMILALSLFEGGEPEYLESPTEWLCTKNIEHELTWENK